MTPDLWVELSSEGSDWLPADAGADGDEPGAVADCGGAEAVGLRGDGRGKDVFIACFDEQLHFAVVIHAAHAVLVAGTDIDAALVGRVVADDSVDSDDAAVIVVAIFGFFRIGEAGDLAIETAATGDVDVVAGLGDEADDGIERERPDVRVAAVGSRFCDEVAGKLVVREAVFGKQGQPVGEVDAGADSELPAPGDVGSVDGCAGAATEFQRVLAGDAVLPSASATAFLACG